MINLKVIAGSSRPGRFNIQPATWVAELAKKRDDVEVELVDLQEVNLPFLDEAVPPLMHQYEKDHTRNWAQKIGEADAYIMVTPEYNHSYSAVLKNAIDYLQQEWNNKPVAFVSYGSIAGGARGVEHLRGVAAEVRLFDIKETVLLPNYWENLDKEGKYQFNERHENNADSMITTLLFWAKVMKDARATMTV